MDHPPSRDVQAPSAYNHISSLQIYADNNNRSSGDEKAVRYRECQKNHAANIGSHALDGCGEFMADGDQGSAGALNCAACGCHRNFHRREVEGEAPAESDDQDGGGAALARRASAVKKRFRTKFSQHQKERMYAFADELGWRIQKHHEPAVQQFCNQVGVRRHVLKVWMHNHKHTLGKKP